jgi:16S rRNA (cytidine1402-2'-O)-methyltransferase
MGQLLVVDVAEDWENTTLRAHRVLCEAVLIVACDASAVEALLGSGDVCAPLLALDSSDRADVLPAVLDALSKGDVAWVSPVCAVPGAADMAFLQRLLAQGIEVLPVPGGSALIAALVRSGLPTDRFSYLGSLPSSSSARRDVLERVAYERHTLAWLTQVGDLHAVLRDVESALGDRRVVCAQFRQQEVWRGQVGEAQAWLASAQLGVGSAPDSCYYVFVEGATQEQVWTDARVQAEVRALLARGESTRDAARVVAQRSGWRKRVVYQIAVEIGDE